MIIQFREEMKKQTSKTLSWTIRTKLPVWIQQTMKFWLAMLSRRIIPRNLFNLHQGWKEWQIGKPPSADKETNSRQTKVMILNLAMINHLKEKDRLMSNSQQFQLTSTILIIALIRKEMLYERGAQWLKLNNFHISFRLINLNIQTI